MNPARTTKSVVVRALVGDFIIAIIKYITAFFSGSSAMLAEAIHTSSDTFNQFLLLFGVNISEKKDRKKYPFGRGREQFFWSFVVAVIVFGVSGVLTFVEGIVKMNSVYFIENPHLVYLVLGLSMVIDGYVLYISLSTFFEKYHKLGYSNLRFFISDFRDPVLLTALVEDIGAIVGVLIAIIGVSLTLYFQNIVYDAVASIFIGVLLMVSGVYLAKESKDLLIGQGLSLKDQNKISNILKSSSCINKVLDVRAVYIGPESVLLTMDLNFKDGLSTEQIENAVDSIERQIKEQVSVIRRIYIEAEEIKVG